MGTEGLNTLGTHKLTKPNLAVKTIDTMKTKNIHLLPTDKPSRLYTVNSINKLDWSEGYLPQVDGTINQNIYITSDEEIKKEDWCLLQKEGKDYIYKCTEKPQNPERWGLKIILTTDQDLIKDGVQAIPNEFLEWFIKNPSCEQVEIRYTVDFNSKAVIVIPKEEPNDFGDIVNEHFWALIDIKQETLEEAANNYLQHCRSRNNIHMSNVIHAERCKNDFKAGAKWQQERSYSEEEVFELCKQFATFIQQKRPSYKKQLKWFEEFKKK